ncbi:MAG: QueT transporter family protein [Clostridiales bacterium]|nr:QueT transporter family protein [Clostridiales bacterium]HBM81604.1 hypothetical protein [Clostridiaceae bacterium]
MKEVFKMWNSTKMVVLVALSAALYAAILIPFKGFVLIPGITEVRPASALPIVLGLLFGPAGAWGSAIGNLIGDFFGTLGPGSIFGFVGNFFFAYVPYKLWANLGIVKSDDAEPDLKSGRKILAFIVCAITGSAACGLIIAWGLELLGLVPFAALSAIITVNNSIPSIVLGIPLLLVLYPRIKKWDLLWSEILPEEDMPPKGVKAKTGAALMTVFTYGGLIAGLLAAMGVGQQIFTSNAGAAGSLGVIIVAGIGVVATILSSLLQ